MASAQPSIQQTATALGIDIGGTNLRVARISSGGEVLDWVAERITRSPEAVLSRILALCAQLDDPTVAAIGVGVPGRVDAQRREVLSGGYLDLTGASLAQRMEAELGRTVVVDNDCNMALVAETATGAARGRENVVMFTIGTGIGGAIVLDGQIVRGRATAAQLGHVTVDHAGLPCVCGRQGCVETTSSGTALGRIVAENGLPAGTTADELFARAAAGEALAGHVLDTWITPLRAAIDSLVAAVDPDLVLLGGGLGGAAHRALARAPARAPWYQCPVEAAKLGDDAGVIGAGISALVEHMMDVDAPAPVVRRIGLAG